MAEELTTNPTPTAADTPVTPAETPIETPVVPAPPPAAPIPEPITPASADSAFVATPAKEAATADKPVEPIPAPVSPAPAPTSQAPAPPPAPSPAPEASSPIQRLLAKAKEKIQFRKQAKLEKIMVFAKAQGGVTNDQAQKLLRISDATASRYLAQLTKSGRLRLVKAVGRGARYTPAP